jgi:putative membrane protein
MYPNYGWPMGNYWWHMGWMWLLWIVIMVVIALVLFRALAAPGRRVGEHRESQGESPEQILKRRYAKGEIDKEEYDRKLTDLRR